MSQNLPRLLREIRSCTHCKEHLPLGPRPVVAASSSAQVMIIGQAPGTAVHASGIPWDDPSGRRLRQWMDVDEHTFYDPSIFAIVPMGFCYPGRGKSGDLPPRPECAPLWHEPLVKHLPQLELILLIGSYAQSYYLKASRKKTLTETVRNYSEYLPKYFTLPHPSPRNNIWLKKNPWFDEEVIPALRQRLRSI